MRADGTLVQSETWSKADFEPVDVGGIGQQGLLRGMLLLWP